jgi:membrane fusion protein, multidrug efflux system
VAVATALLFGAACRSRRVPGGAAAAVSQPPEVDAVTVTPVSVPLVYEFSAQVLPYRRVEVRPRVDGIIRARLFEEGGVVRSGQLLYRIEPGRYEAAFHAAEARVDAAKLQNDRYGPLLAQHAVAQHDADNARAELEAAQAELAQAKRDFDDTFVRAELNGRIGRTMLDVGARVTGPSDVLTTIDRLDSIYVSFQPSAQQVLEWTRELGKPSLLSAGHRRLVVEATMLDGSKVPRTGALDFVAPSIDDATGTQALRAVFPNVDYALTPGQFVRARLVGFTADSVLVVPARAVQTTLGRQFVYVVSAGDTVRARDVETGAWDGEQWIVRQGLNAGERVVVDGTQKTVLGRHVHVNVGASSIELPARNGG